MPAAIEHRVLAGATPSADTWVTPMSTVSITFLLLVVLWGRAGAVRAG